MFMLLWMNRQPLPVSPVALPVPRVPAWAMPRARIEDPVEAAFMAGSALNALDNLVQAEPDWSGAWRHRLALKATAACMRLIGRAEESLKNFKTIRLVKWDTKSWGENPADFGRK